MLCTTLYSFYEILLHCLEQIPLVVSYLFAMFDVMGPSFYGAGEILHSFRSLLLLILYLLRTHPAQQICVVFVACPSMAFVPI